MLLALVYAGVCAPEDISVLDDAILDYSSHDLSTLQSSQSSAGNKKSQNVLDGTYQDYTQVQIDGLEEAEFAAFENIPDDLRVHD